MEKIKRSGLAKNTAVLLAFTLVFGGFTPVPIAGPTGNKEVLASASDALSSTENNPYGEISDGEIYGNLNPSGELEPEEENAEQNGETDTITIYNNYAGEYTLDLSKHCPASWSNAAYTLDYNHTESKYVSTCSIDKSVLKITTKKVGTQEIPDGQIPISVMILSNQGNMQDTPSVSVTVNIKVMNPEIKLSLDNPPLKISETKQIKVTTVPENYGSSKDTTLNWSSNNTNIAVVGTDGKIAGVAAGTAMITCTDNVGIAGKLDITVTQASIPTPTPTPIPTPTPTPIPTPTPTPTSNNGNTANTGNGSGNGEGVTGTGKIENAVKAGSITVYIKAESANNAILGTTILSAPPSIQIINGGITLPKDILLGSTFDTRTVIIKGNNEYQLDVANENSYSVHRKDFRYGSKVRNGRDNQQRSSGMIVSPMDRIQSLMANSTDNTVSIFTNQPISALTEVTLTSAKDEKMDIANHYDKVNGSTGISFHKDFLNQLDPGIYTLRMYYGKRYAETEITINGAPLLYADGSENSSYRAVLSETGGHFSGSANKWTFIKRDGTYAENEWICYSGRLYYLGDGGVMQTGPVRDADGSIYLLSPLHDGCYGAAISGWVTDGAGMIFFFDPENYKMVKGEKTIDHVKYTFANDGHLIS